MAKPLRLRPVTDAHRSARAPGLDASNSAGRHVAQEEGASRPVPWLSFNAAVLPEPVAESAPAFGPNRFLLGANLPWLRYGFDFGASFATPSGGLHASAEAVRSLDGSFERLRRDGVEYARVFLFCDGRAGIRFDEDGTPEGLDGAVFPDVDVLLAAAERHRIGLFLVLFDAGLVAAASVVDGAACGGHSAVLIEPAKRDALFERVLEPLLVRYGAHPAIEGWDIFDEPECATLGMHCPNPMASASARRWGRLGRVLTAAARGLGLARSCAAGPALVPSSAMRSFLGAAVRAVHQHTKALATVGLASTANLALVEGLGLDFYQAHWWEPYGDGPLRRAAADFRLDRPLVLGAFPATTKTKSVKTVLDTARCAGYGGALLWSARAVDARSGQDGQLGPWARNHAAQLYQRPARVELVPPKVVAPELVPMPEVALAVAVVPDVEDDEPRRPRAEAEGNVPGLAAAPA